MAGFISGGNTGVTYDDLQRRRAIAQQLAAGVQRPARNLGGGIASIGNAIGAILAGRNVASASESNRSERDKVFDSLYGPQMARAEATMPTAPEAPAETTPDAPVASPAFKTGTSATNIETAYRTLTEMGYPPHIAAGLTGNLMQESLRKGDINPAAVGDGGAAYGVGQWNGPRKAAYLAFAKEAGANPEDLATQIRFLDHEMKGSERGAYDALMKAKTPEEAATIASSAYWRPGVPMMNNRTRYANDVFSKYGGAPAASGGAPMAAPAAAPSAAPMAAPGGAPMASPTIARLLAAYRSPYLSPEDRNMVGLLLNQEFARNAPPDPYKTANLELSRARLEETRRMNDARLAGRVSDAPNVTVNNNTGEDAFAKKNAERQAEMYSGWMDAGVNAKADMASIGELERLINEVGVGGTTDALAAYFKNNWGLNFASPSVEAYDAIISKLVPAQRPPGSGVMSDRDIDLFKASLPQLINSPEGNRMILQTMRAMAEYRMKLGDIAAGVMSGQVDRNEGIKMANSLPDPLEALKGAMKAKPAMPPGGGAANAAGAAGAALDIPPIPDKFSGDPEIVKLWPGMSPELRQEFIDAAGGR